MLPAKAKLKPHIKNRNRLREDKESQPMANQPPKNDFLLEEWKDARLSVRRFDEHLLNLRRYGFTLATILLGADAYISMSLDVSTLAKAGAAVAVMMLIFTLFLLDKHIQTLQEAALNRAAEIENQLGLGLCKIRQSATHKWQVTHSGTPTYILFLLVTGGLGSISVISTPSTEVVSFLAFKLSPRTHRHPLLPGPLHPGGGL